MRDEPVIQHLHADVVEKARAACNQCRLAFARFVSAQSAIDMLDNIGPVNE